MVTDAKCDPVWTCMERVSFRVRRQRLLERRPRTEDTSEGDRCCSNGLWRGLQNHCPPQTCRAGSSSAQAASTLDAQGDPRSWTRGLRSICRLETAGRESSCTTSKALRAHTRSNRSLDGRVRSMNFPTRQLSRSHQKPCLPLTCPTDMVLLAFLVSAKHWEITS